MSGISTTASEITGGWKVTVKYDSTSGGGPDIWYRINVDRWAQTGRGIVYGDNPKLCVVSSNPSLGQVNCDDLPSNIELYDGSSSTTDNPGDYNGGTANANLFWASENSLGPTSGNYSHTFYIKSEDISTSSKNPIRVARLKLTTWDNPPGPDASDISDPAELFTLKATGTDAYFTPIDTGCIPPNSNLLNDIKPPQRGGSVDSKAGQNALVRFDRYNYANHKNKVWVLVIPGHPTSTNYSIPSSNDVVKVDLRGGGIRQGNNNVNDSSLQQGLGYVECYVAEGGNIDAGKMAEEGPPKDLAENSPASDNQSGCDTIGIKYSDWGSDDEIKAVWKVLYDSGKWGDYGSSDSEWEKKPLPFLLPCQIAVDEQITGDTDRERCITCLGGEQYLILGKELGQFMAKYGVTRNTEAYFFARSKGQATNTAANGAPTVTDPNFKGLNVGKGGGAAEGGTGGVPQAHPDSPPDGELIAYAPGSKKDPVECQIVAAQAVGFTDEQVACLPDRGSEFEVAAGDYSWQLSNNDYQKGKRLIGNSSTFKWQMLYTKQMMWNIMKTQKGLFHVSAGGNPSNALEDTSPSDGQGLQYGGSDSTEFQDTGESLQRKVGDAGNVTGGPMRNSSRANQSNWTLKQYGEFQRYVEKVITHSLAGSATYSKEDIWSFTTTMAYTAAKGETLGDALGKSSWQQESINIGASVTMEGLLEFMMCPPGGRRPDPNNPGQFIDEHKIFDDHFSIDIGIGGASRVKKTVGQWGLETNANGDVIVNKSHWDEVETNTGWVGETFMKMTSLSYNYKLAAFNGWKLGWSGAAKTDNNGLVAFDDILSLGASKFTLTGNPVGPIRWSMTYDSINNVGQMKLGLSARIALIQSVKDRGPKHVDPVTGKVTYPHQRNKGGKNTVFIGPGLATNLDFNAYLDLGGTVTYDTSTGASYGVSAAVNGKVGGFKYSIDALNGGGHIGKTWSHKFPDSWKKWFNGEGEEIKLDFSLRAETGPMTNGHWRIKAGADFTFRKNLIEMGDVLGKLVLQAEAVGGLSGQPNTGYDFGANASIGVYWENNVLEWLGFPFNIHPGISGALSANFHFGGYTDTVEDAKNRIVAAAHIQDTFRFTFQIGGLAWNLKNIDAFRRHMRRQHDSMMPGWLGDCPVLSTLGPLEGVWQYLIRVVPHSSMQKVVEASKKCLTKRDTWWNTEYQRVMKLYQTVFNQALIVPQGMPAKTIGDCECAEKDVTLKVSSHHSQLNKVPILYQDILDVENEKNADGNKNFYAYVMGKNPDGSSPSKPTGSPHIWYHPNQATAQQTPWTSWLNPLRYNYYATDGWPCHLTQDQIYRIVNILVYNNYDKSFDKCQCLETEFEKLTTDSYVDASGYNVNQMFTDEFSGVSGNGELLIRGVLTKAIQKMDKLVLDFYKEGKDPTDNEEYTNSAGVKTSDEAEFVAEMKAIWQQIMSDAGFATGGKEWNDVEKMIENHWETRWWDKFNICKHMKDSLAFPIKLITKAGAGIAKTAGRVLNKGKAKPSAQNEIGIYRDLGTPCGVGEDTVITDNIFSYYKWFEYYRKDYGPRMRKIVPPLKRVAAWFLKGNLKNAQTIILANQTGKHQYQGYPLEGVTPAEIGHNGVSKKGRGAQQWPEFTFQHINESTNLDDYVFALQILSGKPLNFLSSKTLYGVTDYHNILEPDFGPRSGDKLNGLSFIKDAYQYLNGVTSGATAAGNAASWPVINIKLLANSSLTQRGWYSGEEDGEYGERLKQTVDLGAGFNPASAAAAGTDAIYNVHPNTNHEGWGGSGPIIPDANKYQQGYFNKVINKTRADASTIWNPTGGAFGDTTTEDNYEDLFNLAKDVNGGLAGRGLSDHQSATSNYNGIVDKLIHKLSDPSLVSVANTGSNYISTLFWNDTSHTYSTGKNRSEIITYFRNVKNAIMTMSNGASGGGAPSQPNQFIVRAHLRDVWAKYIVYHNAVKGLTASEANFSATDGSGNNILDKVFEEYAINHLKTHDEYFWQIIRSAFLSLLGTDNHWLWPDIFAIYIQSGVPFDNSGMPRFIDSSNSYIVGWDNFKLGPFADAVTRDTDYGGGLTNVSEPGTFFIRYVQAVFATNATDQIPSLASLFNNTPLLTFSHAVSTVSPMNFLSEVKANNPAEVNTANSIVKQALRNMDNRAVSHFMQVMPGGKADTCMRQQTHLAKRSGCKTDPTSWTNAGVSSTLSGKLSGIDISNTTFIFYEDSEGTNLITKAVDDYLAKVNNLLQRGPSSGLTNTRLLGYYGNLPFKRVFNDSNISFTGWLEYTQEHYECWIDTVANQAKTNKNFKPGASLATPVFYFLNVANAPNNVGIIDSRTGSIINTRSD